MQERPIGPLVDALMSNGADIAYKGRKGSLPLSIATTGLKGGKIQLAASISSQYVSSILLAAPYAQEPVTLELTGGVVISQPYIDMTIAMMRSFGVQVERVKDSDGRLTDTYRVPKGGYVSPGRYRVEGDASSATYPLAIAAATGSTCTLTNIGRDSLQGDARFARDVLEPMGCRVVQTETETIVTGPPAGQLRSLGVIDMEPMTDAFLTASVLAAIAPLPAPEGIKLEPGQVAGSTRIHGIANQRVKECDRIAAMRTELAKFGVKTIELDDGLEVVGQNPRELQAGQRVHCYDDHRVAMSFAVLASGLTGSGAIIEEKRCVEKTWPSFWDDLSRIIGIDVEGVDLREGPTASAAADTLEDPTIFIIGMRGAGKTHSSLIAASTLGRPVIDADEDFESRVGLGVGPFVVANGWPAFRQKECEILESLLREYPSGHIISLGGGVVETARCREILKDYIRRGGIVVNIWRDIDDIVAYLSSEGKRPSLGEDLHDIYARRAPWLEECSNYELASHGERALVPNGHHADGSRSTGQVDVARFFRFVTGVDTNHVDLDGRQTFFLPLTAPNVTKILPLLPTVCEGVDAVELRVDLLSPDGKPPQKPHIPPVRYVQLQLVALRRATTLPIVYTVRSHSQGGFFPDEAEAEYFKLVRAGIRFGCEYIDLEMGWSSENISATVMAKGRSKIIASWHDWAGKLDWNSDEAMAKYEAAARVGDIVKIVSTAKSLDDNMSLSAFRRRVSDGKPFLAINMGYQGQLSRILNPIFSIVTHPSLSPSAPGQLSLCQVHEAQHLIGQLPRKRFYLLGTPISHSLSPTIHNTGIRALGLPHDYTLFETAAVDDSIRALLKSADFGGCSVTIPHKLAIIPLLDRLTDHAEKIGAVNTIIPSLDRYGQRRLVGDNTDWLAIKDAIRSKFPTVGPTLTALVLGAGGTARAAVYALQQAGFRTVYVYNRTLEKAHALVGFNVVPVTSLAPETFSSPPAVVISTVPAEGTTTEAEKKEGAGVVLPRSIFARAEGGVAIDMAYKPRLTPLLSMAMKVEEWRAVSGVEILLEQGYHQFRIWHGRLPPRERIAEAVWKEYGSSNELIV
jgi:pentafunctional AROM polypeptide